MHHTKENPAVGSGASGVSDLRARIEPEDTHTAVNAQAASNRLPILAAEIRRVHAEVRQAARMSLERAIEAGELLLEAKEQVKHGAWLDWLRENCEVSARSATNYMRLARHKDVVETKSAETADLTIDAAVTALTEPKWPEKLSDLVHAIEGLPPSGQIKIAVRENAGGWDEVFVAPSRLHEGFFYVTHMWTPRAGKATWTGTRKPVRGDMVAHLLDSHLSFDRRGVLWLDKPFPGWTHNILLFTDIDDYFRSFRSHENVEELVALAKRREPSPEPGRQFRADVEQDRPSRPFHELLFGLLTDGAITMPDIPDFLRRHQEAGA